MGIISTYKRLEEKINTETIYDLSPYHETVAKINAKYESIRNASDSELAVFHQKIKANISERIVAEENTINAFALVKLLAKRLLGLKAYDVQLITGLVLYEGKIAEMKTGEGKTLAGLFPTYLRALEGKGIHIHSFNDYLSERDHQYFKPIFDFLEIRSACICEGQDQELISEALEAEVTYGSAKQFIYTYLKKSISPEPESDIKSRFQYAIIDEADAILLDEATNPFVIAGKSDLYSEDFLQIAKAVKLAVRSNLFEYTDFKRGVYLTDKGVRFLEESLRIESLYEAENVDKLSAINLSLHAHVLLNKDKDYIIKNDEIYLVDEYTGRVVEDRKWRNGLQTAVEAKEGLQIKSEGIILNSISIPNFYKEYKAIAAMTATAKESANELYESYGLVLAIIPPNIPSQRIDHPTRVFRTKKLKYEALISAILEAHSEGRPVLIGTQHVAESEEIYRHLQLRGVSCEILNAKNNALEAEIIAKAGTLGAVTISTNMAGRGTDIKLGGEEGLRKQKIEDLGGLIVFGTNMHRSGRIDRQLRGRAARQGESGASLFFVSLEDDLFDKNKMHKILAKKYKIAEDDEIEDQGILKYLIHAQEVSEDQDNLMRETIKQYAEIAFFQSQIIAQKRSEIWKEKSKDKRLKQALIDMIDNRWALNISELFEIKDGVHFISLGGQNPLRAYRIIADNLFKTLLSNLESEIEKIENAFRNSRAEFESLTKHNRPSSTWTYTASDKGFNSGLESMLKGSSNIAFQIDFLGLTVLFLKYWWVRLKGFLGK